MGDRANIAVIDLGERVYFYTHWRGYRVPELVREALVRGEGRWRDAPYLSRIVFCELIKGDEDGETGFGISPRLGDNEHPIFIVDCDQQKVYLEADTARDERHRTAGYDPPGAPAGAFSFKDYAALERADWDSFKAA